MQPWERCTEDELYDRLEDTCVQRTRTENNQRDASADLDPSLADMDIGEDDGIEDMGMDVDQDVIPEGCDEDGDGVLSIECGGDDCDDNDPRRSPNNREICDHIDNNCSGEVNDTIECTFFAHSGNTLYALDPFALTLEVVTEELPDLLDVDTHPDGTLYGASFDGLYVYLEAQDRWIHVGEFGLDVEDPNGLAIDNDGTIYVTSESNLYEIDITTGAASFVGDFGGSFYSSGDAVVDKGDTLFMTSKHAENTDHLVKLDQQSALGSEVGPVGVTNVFGLTSAWGVLYGLTGRGELLTIDLRTGEGTVIHTFEGTTFFGAASTPFR